jgi:TonB family protein
MGFFVLAAFLLLGLTASFGQTTVQVVAEKGNIRSSPSATAAIVATVKQDESLEVIESRGTWFKVKTSTNVGWIHGNAVQTVNPLTLKAPQAGGPPRLIDKKHDAWGDPNSKYADLSSGPGTGGGMGSGRGQGTGSGTGAGSGGQTTQPVANVGTAETTFKEPANTPFQFLAKPKPSYTESARNNGVQGTVRLKVTFLASGKIGKIVPIKELPDGLTEKAIDAAKLIRFKPQRVKGIPRSAVKLVDYNFYVY